MPATYADKPTSEWEYSHAVADGDVFEHEDGNDWEVMAVNDDGSVDVRLQSDEHDVTDTWTEEAVRTALTHGEMEHKETGESHELATY